MTKITKERLLKAGFAICDTNDSYYDLVLGKDLKLSICFREKPKVFLDFPLVKMLLLNITTEQELSDYYELTTGQPLDFGETEEPNNALEKYWRESHNKLVLTTQRLRFDYEIQADKIEALNTTIATQAKAYVISISDTEKENEKLKVENERLRGLNKVLIQDIENVIEILKERQSRYNKEHITYNDLIGDDGQKETRKFKIGDICQIIGKTTIYSIYPHGICLGVRVEIIEVNKSCYTVKLHTLSIKQEDCLYFVHENDLQFSHEKQEEPRKLKVGDKVSFDKPILTNNKGDDVVIETGEIVEYDEKKDLFNVKFDNRYCFCAWFMEEQLEKIEICKPTKEIQELKVGDICRIISEEQSKHGIKTGSIVEILRDLDNGYYKITLEDVIVNDVHGLDLLLISNDDSKELQIGDKVKFVNPVSVKIGTEDVGIKTGEIVGYDEKNDLWNVRYDFKITMLKFFSASELKRID